MLIKLVRFFVVLFALFSVTIPSFALPLPDGDFNRQQAIDTFFKDTPQNAIEGIWLTEDGKYEIAIVKNDFPVCEGYDYIGFVDQTTDPTWNAGEIRLQLKATAIPELFIGFLHKKANSYLALTDDQSLGTTFKITGNIIMQYLNEKKEVKSLYKIYPGKVNASNAYTRSGTGFFITSNLIVTNCHVIENAQTIEVKYNNGQKISATVIAKDRINDLALLKVSKIEPSVTPLSIANIENAKYGDVVYTVGFPAPSLLGTKAKLGEGIINSITGIQDDVRMFQISIPIQAGNSGGPLINSKGQVVGVVTATVNPITSLILTGSFPQNVNFAMKINYVNNLLSTLPEAVRLPIKEASNDLSPAQIIDQAQKAVVQVEVK
ncbi:MAG: hypothetical protein H6Q67_765 [Firmicutes bacterium]|nr:hypothetical protein [Bacillota bacterium]